MWVLNYLFGCSQWVSAREKFQQAANLIDAEPRMKKSMWGQFWSAHQRFFKYLCIASKVHRVVQLAREEVKHGKVGTEQRATYSCIVVLILRLFLPLFFITLVLLLKFDCHPLVNIFF